ncbi:hypothetical protein FQA39_LY11875 [Lamprigera yunnana]|nr:hypothetical protein FQA39_LY11875 [Lamprigera yunnana]
MDLPCLTKSLLDIANVTLQIPSVPEDLINKRTDIVDEVQIWNQQLNINLHTKTSPRTELNVKRMLNEKMEMHYGGRC